VALGLESAGSGAGIGTLLVDARLRGSALRVQYALRTTARRGSNEVGQAGAGRTVAHDLALGVGSTRRRYT